jgi:hypothetical protein
MDIPKLVKISTVSHGSKIRFELEGTTFEGWSSVETSDGLIKVCIDKPQHYPELPPLPPDTLVEVLEPPANSLDVTAFPA